jgi:hypothetical protein
LSEVTDALDALADGDRTLDDVERFFDEYQWPQRVQPVNRSEAPGDGSFAEVAYAYSVGKITHHQYTRLAEVAVAAQRRQNTQEGS